jgi:hypothetical protein
MNVRLTVVTKPKQPPGEPMTLGNMRAAVRALSSRARVELKRTRSRDNRFGEDVAAMTDTATSAIPDASRVEPREGQKKPAPEGCRCVVVEVGCLYQ